MNVDVAVIGAGLAGLTAARELASRGCSVALIDRKDSLAGAVHTTGIFVRKSWEDFSLPAEQLGPPLRQVLLYSPAMRPLALQAEQDEFRLGRMRWIYLALLEQCARAGVQWMPSRRLLGIDGRRLLLARKSGAEESVNARFIVGADGARSTVATSLGLDRNREWLTGLEEVLPPTGGEPALHCFLDPRLAPGYIGWLADDGEEAHLGVAGYHRRFDPARSLQQLRQRLAHTIPLGKPIERRGGLIPLQGVLPRIANARGLLVGDAAGAVSPLTAGGLDGAIRLSTFAAEVIEAYLSGGDERALGQYNGARFRARFLTRRWMRHLMRWASTTSIVEMGCAALHLPPMRRLAEHIFFSRGSFPELRFDRPLSSLAGQSG